MNADIKTYKSEVTWIFGKFPEYDKNNPMKRYNIMAYGSPLIGESEKDIIVETAMVCEDGGFTGHHQHSVICYSELPAAFDPNSPQKHEMYIESLKEENRLLKQIEIQLENISRVWNDYIEGCCPAWQEEHLYDTLRHNVLPNK